jgi:antitoxin MazE
MKAHIGKWGNSAALRLPAAVMKGAQLSLQQDVTITATRGRIVIEPAEVRDFDLDTLVAGMTPENNHTEIAFGEPAGRESL